MESDLYDGQPPEALVIRVEAQLIGWQALCPAQGLPRSAACADGLGSGWARGLFPTDS